MIGRLYNKMRKAAREEDQRRAKVRPWLEGEPLNGTKEIACACGHRARWHLAGATQLSFECSQCGGRQSVFDLPRASISDRDLTYLVQTWTDDGAEVFATVAKASHFTVADKAFSGAISAYPGMRVSLSDGCRDLKAHTPEELRGMERRKIEAILTEYGVPAGFADVSAVRAADNTIRVELRDLAGRSVQLDLRAAENLIAAMNSNGYGDYAIPISSALLKASS